MRDCRMTMSVKDNKIIFEGENVGINEASILYGMYGQYVGEQAARLGNTLDRVKDNLLDIHLASMQMLTEQLIRERGNQDACEAEADDAERDPGEGRV